MRVLVLWADDRSTNLGVRALGAGAAALVEQAFTDVEVDFQSFGSGAGPVSLGPRSTALSLVHVERALRSWIRQYDLVLDTRAGDSFSDIYGASRMITMSGMAEIIHQERVPLVLAPQTVGPFGARFSRSLARRSLTTSVLAFARDSRSRAVAEELAPGAIRPATDVVFALPVPDGVSPTTDVLLNVSGLLWHEGPHVDSRTYRATVVELYRRLVADGRSVTLFPHVLASQGPDDDMRAVSGLVAELGPSTRVTIPTSLEEARRAVAGASLVIGARMHACLNALSVGTPAISMAYSRKFAPLLGDIGWDRTVDLRADGDHVSQILRLAAAPSLNGDARASCEAAHELLKDVPLAIAGAIA